uniref:Putative secreted protein n=1 Tax=Anopheles marajoara TaxID=58244 RepID=A0A2M4CBN1_9DIPT
MPSSLLTADTVLSSFLLSLSRPFSLSLPHSAASLFSYYYYFPQKMGKGITRGGGANRVMVMMPPPASHEERSHNQRDKLT